MGKKTVFEEVLAKFFQIWLKWKIHWFKKLNTTQVQEMWKKQNTTYTSIKMKCLKMSNNEKILKAPREKSTHHLQRNKNKDDSKLLVGNNARLKDSGATFLKHWKKKISIKNFISNKNIYKNEDKIFSYKNRIHCQQTCTTINVKEVLQLDGKIYQLEILINIKE